jgi:hypothetical protein
MKKRIPLFLVAIGIALIAGGFIYDVFFAGIPYQDPTPEMQAGYLFHARVASAIRWLGAGVITLAPVIAFACSRKPGAHRP